MNVLDKYKTFWNWKQAFTRNMKQLKKVALKSKKKQVSFIRASKVRLLIIRNF